MNGSATHVDQREAGPSAVSSRRRNRTLDGLKATAISGVVLAHVAGWGSETQHSAAVDMALTGTEWTVIAFFTVSGYLWGSREHTPADAWKIWNRLLLPYLIWTVFYFALESAVGLQPRVTGRGWLAVIFAGQTSWHLWFLPALAGCQLIALWVRSQRSRLTLAAVGVASLLADACIPGLAEPISLVLDATFVGGLAGFFGGSLLAEHHVQPPHPWLCRGVCLIALVTVCVVPLFLSTPGLVSGMLTVFAGLILALIPVADAAYGRDSFKLAWVGSFGTLVFGVYLLHMIPVDLLRLYASDATVGLVQMAGVWIAVLAASFALSAALVGTKFGRMALGEAKAEKFAPVLKAPTKNKATNEAGLDANLDANLEEPSVYR